MRTCYDEGTLRAYLDGELQPLARAAVAEHIAGCRGCEAALAALRERTARLRALLPPADAPSPHEALRRAREAANASLSPAAGNTAPAQPRSIFMQVSSFFASGQRRAVAGALAALVALLALLALPPVRAAADELLSVFRVQKVVFVPIDQARLRQLGDLKIDKSTLFLGKPEVSNTAPPRTVASADEAAAAVGHPLSQPATLPGAPASTVFTVLSGGNTHFQVNLATARQVLDALDIHDVALPEALGTAPVSVEVPAFVSTRYQGAGYDLTLHQSTSPKVTLPDGVELAQLGKAALRVLGMTPEQAELASGQINWNNTLLFPFPSDTNNIRQVTVGGEQALLVVGGPRNGQHGQIYWQRGDQLLMLEARGDSSAREEDIVDLLIRTAESVR